MSPPKRPDSKKSFSDRWEAGRRLAERLKTFGLRAPVVYAIPRGGVPVARPVAEALDADIDIVLAHKFTSTRREELALGSVTDAGDIWFAPHATMFLTEEELQEAATAEAEKLKRRRADLTPMREPVLPEGRDVVIVDDGIATGATAVAAVRALRKRGAARILVAVPVASVQAIERLREEGAELCAILVPESFRSVSEFYDDFSQLGDDEVMEILKSVNRPGSAKKKNSKAARPSRATKDRLIELSDANLSGTLRLPAKARGVVVFAHGGGTNRKSPRNQIVARELSRAGFATLLLDFLEENEAFDRWRVFDTDLLAKRLREVTEWLSRQERTKDLAIGYYGVGTGAAAALKAASALPETVSAIVSQGGRPDLAAEYLPLVQSPSIFIVGENDKPVHSLNSKAVEKLECENTLVTVAGAGHLFEEPGTLEEAARIARSWFERYLKKRTSPWVLAPFESPPASSP